RSCRQCRHPSRGLAPFLPQTLGLQHLCLCPPLQHPPAHLARFVDLYLKQQRAVRFFPELLRVMPAGFADEGGDTPGKAHPHPLCGVTDKHAERVAMALGKVVVHMAGEEDPRGTDPREPVCAENEKTTHLSSLRFQNESAGAV